LAAALWAWSCMARQLSRVAPCPRLPVGGGYEMAVVRDAGDDSEPAVLEQLSFEIGWRTDAPGYTAASCNAAATSARFVAVRRDNPYRSAPFRDPPMVSGRP
jgi:hypothetical protein